MYDSNLSFDLKSIYIIMVFSFISAFIGFILYSPHDISEKKEAQRINEKLQSFKHEV
jgi:hypothetical protein